MEIRASAGPWHKDIELLIQEVRGEERVAVVKTLTLETLEHVDMYVAPSLHISNQAAQVLMDDLWDAGLRPSEGSGSAGALRAVERHLEDMRRIAFAKIEVQIQWQQQGG